MSQPILRRWYRGRKRDYSTYFIQARTGGPIKIGKSTYIAGRLADLQFGSPVRLRCIAWIPFDFEDEIHKRFSRHRLRGEWFSPASELLFFIRVATQRGKPGASWWPKDQRYDKERQQEVMRWLGR